MNSDKIDRKNSIGVAFSGGGLQGIAHIGAVQALYELGIHPQYVSGTSSGAAKLRLNAKQQNIAMSTEEIPIASAPRPLAYQIRNAKNGDTTARISHLIRYGISG